MAKKIKNKGEKEGFFKKIGRAFSARSKGAEKATIVLFVLILLSIISGIFGFYLFEPAKEIYISESQMHKEIRAVYDYSVGTDERSAQETRAQEAQSFYGSIMDKYVSNDNAVIQAYAGLHSNFIKILIAIAIVLPYFAIGLMFIGNPINFIFAIVNMLLVVPIKSAIFLFCSFRSEKRERKPSKHLELKEAAN